MPKINRVKKAQQRYEMRPVLDDSGREVVTLTARKSKAGKPIFQRKTEEDRSKPLPNYRCDNCGREIEVGQPYKWVSVKSGPFGGMRRNRCDRCPDWREWDLSSSLSANVALIVYQFEQETMNVESGEHLVDAGRAAAEALREIVEEKRSSADSVRDGFGHDTCVSEELDRTADALEQWADEIEGFQPDPENPEAEDTECEDCYGTGLLECEDCNGTGNSCTTCDGNGNGPGKCAECDGRGTMENIEPTMEQVDAWRDDVLSGHPIGDCPL